LQQQQQQQQKEEADGEEQEQEHSAASSPEAAAAANQAPGLDVFASAAAASSSRQWLPAYSWQVEGDEQQQFDSEQPIGFNQLQGQVAFGRPGGFDVADAVAADSSDLPDGELASAGATAGFEEQYVAAAAALQEEGFAGSWHDVGSEDEQWQQLPGRPDWRQQLQSLVNPGTAVAAAENSDADAGLDSGLDAEPGSDTDSYRSVFAPDEQPLVDSIFAQAERRSLQEADMTAADAAAAPATAAAALQGGPRRPLWGPGEQAQLQGGRVSDSSGGSCSSGLKKLLTPDFAMAFMRCAKDWEKLQQQGGPLRQRTQQQQQQQVLPLAAADVQAFQPSQQQHYFAVAGEEAVRGWVGLLVAATSGSRTVRSHVDK
jgi:hypothetical protein